MVLSLELVPAAGDADLLVVPVFAGARLGPGAERVDAAFDGALGDFMQRDRLHGQARRDPRGAGGIRARRACRAALRRGRPRFVRRPGLAARGRHDRAQGRSCHDARHDGARRCVGGGRSERRRAGLCRRCCARQLSVPALQVGCEAGPDRARAGNRTGERDASAPASTAALVSLPPSCGRATSSTNRPRRSHRPTSPSSPAPSGARRG